MSYRYDPLYRHGGWREPGAWGCRHCGTGFSDIAMFFRHIPLHRHLKLFAESLQQAKVMGVDPDSADNLIANQLFGGKSPVPRVVLAYAAAAKLGDWP